MARLPVRLRSQETIAMALFNREPEKNFKTDPMPRGCSHPSEARPGSAAAAPIQRKDRGSIRPRPHLRRPPLEIPRIPR